MSNFDEVKERYQLRGVNPDRLKAIQKYAGDSVLDVGCGGGAYVYRLKNEKTIFGSDYQSFESWSDSPDLFSVADATQLKFEAQSIDTVVSFETLEHLADPGAALREFHRVAKKNLIITVPNCQVPAVFSESNLIYSHWNDPTHRQFFTAEAIAALVEENGFRVDQVSFINRVRVEKMFEGLVGPLSFPLAWLVSKLILPQLKKRQQYFITILLVASKK